jgi:DHA3 family tetracycline resistance protein-like MFS transporter
VSNICARNVSNHDIVKNLSIRFVVRSFQVEKKIAIIQLAKHREPRLLVTGQTISQFGDGVALVALTLLVLDTTHSASKLAWFVAARMTPLVIFLLIGGAIVDRFSRRILLLISDCVRAILTAILVVLIATEHLKYGDLLIFAVLFGTFDAVFMPCITALTPEIVPEELLPAMNAVRPLSNNLMGNMIGPAVGGVIYAASASWAISVDCATFVVSAGALFLMKPTPTPHRTPGSSMLAEIKEGIRYVRATRWLRTGLLAAGIANAIMFSPMAVLIPFLLRHTFHDSKVVVGYTFAVMGLSGAIGALVASNLKTPRRRIRVMFTFWTISSLSGLIVGFATNFWEVMIFPVVASPLLLLGNVIWESMMQTEVPRDLLGRASSVDWFMSLGLAPIGLVVAGLLATEWGVRTYFVVVSLLSAAPGIWIILSRKINEVDAGRVKQSAVAEPPPATFPLGESPSSQNLGI